MISVKVPYTSALHSTVKNAIMERRRFSEQKMNVFHKQWDAADDSMRAYIHEREIDKRRKDHKVLAGEVDYITLEVPYIYAIIMTAHTYFSSVMLSRSPVYQFTGRHGEPQDSIMAVEAIMDYQLKVGLHLPVMYNWLYDLARYSLGIVGVYWDVEEKVVTHIVKEPVSIFGVPLGTTRTTEKTEVHRGYAGNKLYNVRPYDFYPDPRVPIWRFQEGEFVERNTSEGYHNILAMEHTLPGYYTNLKELVQAMRNSSSDRPMGSPRVEMPLQPGEASQAPGPGFVKITDAYIKLVPKLWGLGTSSRMEIWCFQLAEDEVVISAKPLGAIHNQFPFQIMEGNFGSEEFAKFGMLEVIRPLTDILTWLVNSHFYNVRRILNNQLVVDPSRLVMKDLTKPGQRLIRLKPAAYGTDPKVAVHQLTHIDVTQRHLSDAQYIEQMVQRVSSVVDNVMGMPQQGGRRTATEARQTTGWSTNRLRTPVEYNSSLALDPLSQMMISSTQQFMDTEQKYAIAGNLLETAQRFILATPDLIAGSYDFVPVDGTLPIDRLAQANFWKELLMQMSRSPEIMAQWDIGGMIAHTLKLQGERNVDRFRIQAQVAAPGVDLAQEAQRGNVVPVGGFGGRGNGAARSTGTSGGTI